LKPLKRAKNQQMPFACGG